MNDIEMRELSLAELDEVSGGSPAPNINAPSENTHIISPGSGSSQTRLVVWGDPGINKFSPDPLNRHISVIT